MVEPIDDEGRRIEAAGVVYDLAKTELERLKETSADLETMGALLHLVVMTWVDEYIRAGLLTEDEPEYDSVSGALAELDARIRYVEDTSVSVLDMLDIVLGILPCAKCRKANSKMDHPGCKTCKVCPTGFEA